jgi:hypothetical protein
LQRGSLLARQLASKSPRGTLHRSNRSSFALSGEEMQVMGKGILLWLIGVPIPLILIGWLIFH